MNYLFVCVCVCNLLILVQIETSFFLLLHSYLWLLPEAVVERQGCKCSQFIWKMIPRNTNREGDGGGTQPIMVASSSSVVHWNIIPLQNSGAVLDASFRVTSPGARMLRYLHSDSHHSLVEGCCWGGALIW